MGRSCCSQSIFLKKQEKRMERFREFGKRLMSFRTRESYWQQAVKPGKKIQMCSISAGVTLVTAWLYYRSGWAAVVLLPMGAFYYRSLEKECMEKRKSEFLVQFKEGIQSMAASLRAGYSVENAVKETYRELLRMYEEEEMICKEFAYMVQQIRLRIPAEEVFEELAGRVRLEDVRSFANVFAAAKRNGGDMMEIIKNTANKIGDKIDVKREIDTMLAAKRYEFRVMSVIPYAIIAYMTLSFPEFMGCLYGNVIGMGVMSVCLGIYMAAYALGAGMVEIEV